MGPRTSVTGKVAGAEIRMSGMARQTVLIPIGDSGRCWCYGQPDGSRFRVIATLHLSHVYCHVGPRTLLSSMGPKPGQANP